jgi:hypothetical protein
MALCRGPVAALTGEEPMMDELPRLAAETSVALHHLQGLDDAIAFRSARLAGRCADCPPGGRCADHASDERLIAAYRQRHAAALREFLARFDPGDVSRVMTGSDGTPPTVLACALAMSSRLRELAADGPVLARLGGAPVIIELDGGQLIEYPLTSGSGRAGSSPADR